MLEHAASGFAALVLDGEPGIGKTALLGGRASGGGGGVASASCRRGRRDRTRSCRWESSAISSRPSHRGCSRDSPGRSGERSTSHCSGPIPRAWPWISALFFGRDPRPRSSPRGRVAAPTRRRRRAVGRRELRRCPRVCGAPARRLARRRPPGGPWGRPDSSSSSRAGCRPDRSSAATSDLSRWPPCIGFSSCGSVARSRGSSWRNIETASGGNPFYALEVGRALVQAWRGRERRRAVADSGQPRNAHRRALPAAARRHARCRPPRRDCARPAARDAGARRRRRPGARPRAGDS